MPEPFSRQTIYEAVLNAYQTEHEELAQTLRNVETKAQGCVAIAGIFLAGLFTYARDAGSLRGWELTRFLAAIVGLTLSVLGAAYVLLVRIRVAALLGSNVQRLADDLESVDDRDLSDRYPGFVGDQANVWKSRVEALAQFVTRKADLLFWAQILLAGGALVTIATLLVKVLQ